MQSGLAERRRRESFVNDLLRAVRAFSATTRNAKISPKFAQRPHAVADRVADLVLGDAVADADVHVLAGHGLELGYGSILNHNENECQY